MRKYIAVIVSIICVLGVVGCNNKSMNYIISNEPNIVGIITEVNENSVLIENETGEYVVSLDVENSDGIYSPMMIGDEVTVYYDDSIAESYSMQINQVYAILLKEPADRTVNEQPQCENVKTLYYWEDST